MPTIAEHMLSPDVTIDEHARRSQISLGQALAKRRAIYLDMNYWILLRAADMNLGSSKAVELLGLLRKGVAAGILFCPISESVFVELMKQGDPASRLMTASLIDELSLGATLVEQEARLATEIAHFIYSSSGRNNLHPLNHLVWCKLSYVLGFLHPTKTPFDLATEVAIQKAFFDHMWTISLRETVTIIGDVPGTDMSEIATMLNAGVAANADQLRSFAQAYSAEVRGIVDLVGGTAIDIVASMALEAGVASGEPSSEQRRMIENQYKNLFAIALEQDRARDALRTMHIMASLHASHRWNKGRKFRGNDLFDFNHAAAALAYCDAFFTEGPLRTMVTQQHIALDKLYGCHVVSEIDEATAYLRNLV